MITCDGCCCRSACALPKGHAGSCRCGMPFYGHTLPGQEVAVQKPRVAKDQHVLTNLLTNALAALEAVKQDVSDLDMHPINSRTRKLSSYELVTDSIQELRDVLGR